MTSSSVSEAGPAVAPRRHTRLSRRDVAIAGLVVLGLAGAGYCGWRLYDGFHDIMGMWPFWYAAAFAFVPVLPLGAIFWWLNRLRPEPWGVLALALLWGALAATVISLELNGWLSREIGDVRVATPRSAVFVAPWVEEVAKATIIFAVAFWRRHDFNAVVAGVVVGGLAGIGFAFTENILYYGQHFESQGDEFFSFAAFDGLFWWRGVKAPFVHPMFTMMTGVGIGLAVRYRHVGVRILAPVAGFCLAALLHMGYNSVASFAATGQQLTALYVAILLPTLVALVAIVAAVRRHGRRVIEARLGDYTAYGWLKAGQIPFIANPRQRRRARRHVKPFGNAERDRLLEFQRAGLDLGVLRDRMVRGVAGAAELTREKELIETLRSLRGRILLPTPSATDRDQLSPAGSSW